MKTACGRTLGAPAAKGTGLVWFVDPDASSKTSAGCDARIGAYNSWCEVSAADGVETHWGQKP